MKLRSYPNIVFCEHVSADPLDGKSCGSYFGLYTPDRHHSTCPEPERSRKVLVKALPTSIFIANESLNRAHKLTTRLALLEDARSFSVTDNEEECLS